MIRFGDGAFHDVRYTPGAQAQARAQAPRAPYPLSARAAALVASLPTTIRLRSLRADYPEVLDLIAGCWDEPDALARTCDHLMFGGRSGMQKLSMLALLEVTTLQRHAAARLPRRKTSVWDTVFDAVR